MSASNADESGGTSGASFGSQPAGHAGAERDRPSLSRLHLWQFQAVRDVLLIAAIVALIWLGYAMRSVTVPLLIALLLAYLFEPLVATIVQRWRVGRPVAVGGVMVTAGVVVLVASVVAVSAVVNQTTQFIEEIRTGRLQERVLMLRDLVPEQYRELADDWLIWMDGSTAPDGEPSLADPSPAADSDDTAAEGTESDGEDASSSQATAGESSRDATAGEAESSPRSESEADREAWVRSIVRDEMNAGELAGKPAKSGAAINWLGIARGGMDAVWSFIGRIVAIGFLAFLIPFYLYFFSVWFPGILRFGKSLIPEDRRERALELAGKMDRVVAGFVRGRIIVSLIMGVLLAIGWAICGVPYAVVLGLLTGIFCAVPFLGVVGVPVAIILLFVEKLSPGGSLNMAWWAIILWPTVVFSAVQFIEGYVLTPLIAGKATNLDPVTMVVAVIAGGSVMGAYGMLLAIPVAACLKILVMEVLMPKVRAWTEGRAEDPLPIE